MRNFRDKCGHGLKLVHTITDYPKFQQLYDEWKLNGTKFTALDYSGIFDISIKQTQNKMLDPNNEPTYFSRFRHK